MGYIKNGKFLGVPIKEIFLAHGMERADEAD